VVGNAGENVGEPGLRIDAIELGRFDQRIGDGGRLSAAQGTHEEIDEMTVFHASRASCHA